MTSRNASGSVSFDKDDGKFDKEIGPTTESEADAVGDTEAGGEGDGGLSPLSVVGQDHVHEPGLGRRATYNKQEASVL